MMSFNVFLNWFLPLVIIVILILVNKIPYSRDREFKWEAIIIVAVLFVDVIILTNVSAYNDKIISTSSVSDMQQINMWQVILWIYTPSIATVFGSIAYLNYKRKSGVSLTCMIQSIESNEYGDFIHKILIQNNKDRNVIVNVLYLMIDNSDIMRLNIVKKDQKDFVKDEVILIKAYETTELEFSSGPLFSQKENAYVSFNSSFFNNPKNKIKLAIYSIDRTIHYFPLISLWANINNKFSLENIITIDKRKHLSSEKIVFSCNKDKIIKERKKISNG